MLVVSVKVAAAASDAPAVAAWAPGAGPAPVLRALCHVSAAAALATAPVTPPGREPSDPPTGKGQECVGPGSCAEQRQGGESQAGAWPQARATQLTAQVGKRPAAAAAAVSALSSADRIAWSGVRLTACSGLGVWLHGGLGITLSRCIVREHSWGPHVVRTGDWSLLWIKHTRNAHGYDVCDRHAITAQPCCCGVCAEQTC